MDDSYVMRPRHDQHRVQEFVLDLIRRGRRSSAKPTTTWLIDEVKAKFGMLETPVVVRRLVRDLKAKGKAAYTEGGWRLVG